MPKEFTSKNGFKIIVGTNSKDNHYLTHTLAKPSDIFFHVNDLAGSHVILVTEPDRHPLMADMQGAAFLAHYHSKAKLKLKASVCYTEKANVMKTTTQGEVALKKFKNIKTERTEDLLRFFSLQT